ncbi:MAG TPA: hypothetical protein VK934_01190 [Fimbriimonas sp.]|nr:hypothetical protein [Fimbriimonas sp.]
MLPFFFTEQLIVRSSKSYAFENATWRVDEVEKREIGAYDAVKIYCNGRLVLVEEKGGMHAASFIKWPYPGRLLAVAEHSYAGHGQTTRFFQAHKGKVIDLGLSLDAERGGPIFRDLDRDGKLEVIFDNDDWYVFYGKPPTELHAYKFADGKLTFWKKLPNKSKKRLPQRLPAY